MQMILHFENSIVYAGSEAFDEALHYAQKNLS